ncbi:hypothetical protein NLU13_8082 [Sarocladium strictum]|uniref:WD repeat protein n=1 Tax=Sarocladium strictum TaxID=5046 RepID=A0AA39GAZ6_SARSR|nr:hypothetical protein NLU13_8082 [Sarocladium strictum]
MSLTRDEPADVSRLHAQVPVTALAIHESHLLAAQDNTLCIYEVSSGRLIHQRSPRAFTTVNAGQPIHGIHVHPGSGAILLWGASAVAYLPGGWEGGKEISGKAKDWIYAGALSPGKDAGFGVVVTAHNDLVPVSLGDPSGTLVFGQPISASRPILYSATLSFLSADTLLVVGGTVFGEILVWRCHLGSAALISQDGTMGKAEMLYTLTGHEGSIFGVTISPPLGPTGKRILASCSDDRTIRLWDITESNAAVEIHDDNAKAARETGFNTTTATSSKPIAVAMGHASRIWGVRIVTADQGASTVVYSFGEDATMQRWAVDLEAGKLTHEQTFSLNDGKHLWAHALATRADGSLLFATGGADSRISLIEEAAPSAVSRSNLTSIDIKDVLHGAPAISGSTKRAKEIITRYDFLSADELVAMTSSGRILRGVVGATAEEWRIVNIENKDHAGDLSLCYALRSVSPGVVALGTTSGNVYLYDMDKGLSLVTSLDGRIMDLIAVQGPSDPNGSVDVYVQLQGNKAPWYLTVNTTSSTLVTRAELTDLDERFVAVSALKARGYILIGSRHGFLSVLKPDNTTNTNPVILTLPPRAPDAISCIIEIPPDYTTTSDPPLYILTTSRDGHFRIYHLQDSSYSSDITLQLLHETPAPFGPILTGASFTPSSSTAPPELILHGFRGKDFLIYNETHRVELASIHCGGAHRMHCLWTDPLSSSRLRFAFTRTSLLSIYAQETVSHRTLTPGTHGREIRALASNGTYLATGSEDTTIRMWSISPETTDQQPHHLMTMKAHNTGIQQLCWLGQSHLLSSGGFEEFFIWRVRRLNDSLYTGVAVMREAKLEDTGGDTDGDLRIMDFDACWVTGREEMQMIVTMALSDSTLKTYTYAQDEGFVRRASGRYTGACITQVRHLTNGTASPLHLVTGSTDGHLCIWREDQESETYHLETALQTHQNTVKAMDMISHDAGHLVLTGGDDNSVRLSYISLSESSDTDPKRHYTITNRANFPRAHTASINGVAILTRSPDRPGYLGVSASNDQRVKVWDLGDSGQKLSLLADRYSGVADPGDLEILHHNKGALAIGGVGMEVWHVKGTESPRG